MLQDHADFALQEQTEDNLMVAKPIKSLELHYTMIQFLIISYILVHFCVLRRLLDWDPPTKDLFLTRPVDCTPAR